jgi:glyoxylase-like metal-dependent hydrolase (beta-lactamase superfamily II)
MSVRVDHAVSSGTFSLDGATHQVDNNIWVIGDDHDCLVIDAPHSVEDGQSIKVGGAALTILHTPGHAPGAGCIYVHDLGCIFTDDALFEGRPGATRRSFSDLDLIEDSIRRRLLELPDETVVHTGHGSDTTIGAERDNLG